MKRIFLVLLIIITLNIISYGQVLKTLTPDAGKITTICFYPNGNKFVFGTRGDFIMYSNCEDKKVFKKIETGDVGLHKIKISPSGKYLGASFENAGFVEGWRNYFSIWDLESYKEIIRFKDGPLTQGFLFDNYDNFFLNELHTYGNQGSSSKSEYYENFLSIYNLNLDVTKILMENDQYYNEFKYDATIKSSNWEYSEYYDLMDLTGSKIITKGINSKYLIYDYTEKKIISKLESIVKNDYNDITLNNDKTKMADCGYGEDRSWIYIWDLNTSKSIKTLRGHTKDVYTVAFSPDGKFLASGSKDETIKLWDVNTGKLLKTLPDHKDNVNCVRFSPDGKYLVSGSDDKTVIIWDAIALLPDLKIFATEYEVNYGIRKKLQDEMESQIKIIESNFQPKGEFETTDLYEARLKEKNDKIAVIKEYYNSQLKDQQSKQQQNLEILKQQKQNENSSIVEKSLKDSVVNISSISIYNADKQTFQITIKGYTYEVAIPLSDAPSFKENWKKVTVRCKTQLMDDLKTWRFFDFVIINPVTKAEYNFGDKK